VNRAAELCPKILKRDAILWEKWVFRFAELGHLKAVVDYIPIANPTLKNTVYEMVLAVFLSSDSQAEHEKFKSLIIEWPSTLYNIKSVIAAVKKRLGESSDDPLMDALAKL
jgi:hypothetical protein